MYPILYMHLILQYFYYSINREWPIFTQMYTIPNTYIFFNTELPFIIIITVLNSSPCIFFTFCKFITDLLLDIFTRYSILGCLIFPLVFKVPLHSLLTSISGDDLFDSELLLLTVAYKILLFIIFNICTFYPTWSFHLFLNLSLLFLPMFYNSYSVLLK